MFLWQTLTKTQDGKMKGISILAPTFSAAIKLILENRPDAIEYFDIEQEKWIKVQ